MNDHEDERKSKVGRIKDDELFLLDSIEPCSKFRLEQTALKRLGGRVPHTQKPGSDLQLVQIIRVFNFRQILC